MKPITAQQLIDWMKSYGEELEKKKHWLAADKAFEVARACETFLMVMEKDR